MAQFQAGNNPADHTVREVMEYLTGGEELPAGEYDRIMTAERDGKARVGILSGSGQEDSVAVSNDAMEQPDGEPAAGPNEAATGQYSPADHAKTVDDPQASGDAGLTAEQYPDDALSSLGPEMPQSQAEEDAHAATIAAAPMTRAERNAKPVDYTDGEEQRFTPEEALRHAQNRAREWVNATSSRSNNDDD